MEELNLERMTRNVIEKCWNDIQKYPKMEDIYRVTGLSERTVYRYAKRYNLPPRKTLRKLSGMKIAAILLLVCFTVSSCATNGYGCKGRSKIITRVKQ